MLQNLSSVAVVIGALRVNNFKYLNCFLLDCSTKCFFKTFYSVEDIDENFALLENFPFFFFA